MSNIMSETASYARRLTIPEYEVGFSHLLDIIITMLIDFLKRWWATGNEN